MELHGSGEVEEEVGEVGALGGQLVQDRMGDHVHRHLQVAQRRAEPGTAQSTAAAQGVEQRKEGVRENEVTNETLRTVLYCHQGFIEWSLNASTIHELGNENKEKYLAL